VHEWRMMAAMKCPQNWVVERAAMVRIAVWLVIFCASATQIGCGASKAGSDSAFEVLGTAGSAGLTSSDIAAARLVAPPRGGSESYRHWGVGNQTLVVEVETGGDGWIVRRSVQGHKSFLACVDFWSRGADGSVVMARQLDYVESVEVIFDPPLVVMPASLVRGKSVE